MSESKHINFAYHLDAGLYAEYLTDFAQKHNIKRTEGKVNDVKVKDNSGYIESDALKNGDSLKVIYL